MSVVITSKYRSEVTRLFVEDVTFNDYYLFVSSTANTETAIPTGLDVFNTNASKNEFLEKTLFGKKIDPDEVLYMIRNRPWVINGVYDQYDDNADVSSLNYYAVVYPENNETGNYRIYKCLFNNYGSASVSPPNYSDDTPDQIYKMADGYVWKHMYSLSIVEFDKYNTQGYIPIITRPGDFANTAVVVNSSIDQIFVENFDTNRGYEKVEGFIREVNSDSGRIEIVATRSIADAANTELTIQVETPGDFNKIANYYAGYSFYVTTDIGSQVYKVNTYEYNPSTGASFITLVEGAPNDGILAELSTFSLLPRVEIRGDGEGALAIPNVSDEGVITDIQVLNKGDGYKNAVAFIPDPFAFDPVSLNSLDERVILRPVLSPVGGHGSNIIEELSCRHALAYVAMTEADNQIVPTSNDFGSVGIVKNPEFKVFPSPEVFDNRIELNFTENPLFTNEIVTQIETADTSSQFFNEVRFKGKVHEVSGNTAFICEYMGPYPNDVNDGQALYANTDFSDISLKLELPLISSQNQILNINTSNGFTISPYVQRTGEVYYMNRVFPITRTENSREQFKILLGF